MRRPRPVSGVSYLYSAPLHHPSPEHQVEGILIFDGGTLLCKGQEGAGGRDVEQRWDPVGDPFCIFLLEQSAAVEGA